jgi:2-dehydropantoate 2-reductase
VREIGGVLVVGAGAVGSAVAGIIDRGLPGSVRILAGPERAARLRETGLVLNGERRDFALAAPGETSGSDLILVAVKNRQLPEAIKDMESHVGKDSLILSLMNGIDSEDALAAAFGRERVPWAMILGIDAVREGRSTRYSSAGKVHFGDAKNPAGRLSERITRIASFFGRAGLGYEIPEDMIRSMWFKFMINAGINQASAVLGAPYGTFQGSAAARRLMEASMREVIALSGALGTGLVEADLELWNQTLQRLRPEGKTSMLQDIEAGRRTEVDIFAGKVVELARPLGLAVPVNETLLMTIRALEESSGASPA